MPSDPYTWTAAMSYCSSTILVQVLVEISKQQSCSDTGLPRIVVHTKVPELDQINLDPAVFSA